MISTLSVAAIWQNTHTKKDLLKVKMNCVNLDIAFLKMKSKSSRNSINSTTTANRRL